MRYGLGADTVYLSTKKDPQAHDDASKDISRSLAAEFRILRPDAEHSTYEHRLIDDMVAESLKWEGGYVGRARTTTATCSRTPSRRASGHSADDERAEDRRRKTVEAEAATDTAPAKTAGTRRQADPSTTDRLDLRGTRGLEARGREDGRRR